MEPFVSEQRGPVEVWQMETLAGQATGSGQNGALRQPCRFEGCYIPLGVYDTLYRAVADSERPCDLPHTLAFAPQRDHLSLHISTHARPPQDLALCPGALQASLDPLHDHAALKLREHPEHLKE